MEPLYFNTLKAIYDIRVIEYQNELWYVRLKQSLNDFKQYFEQDYPSVT